MIKLVADVLIDISRMKYKKYISSIEYAENYMLKLSDFFCWLLSSLEHLFNKTGHSAVYHIINFSFNSSPCVYL